MLTFVFRRPLRWLLAVLLLAGSPLCAQSLEDILEIYTGENGEAYLGPVPDLLTSSFHTGLFPDSRLEPGFHLYLGATFTYAFVSGDQKTFTATLSDPLATQSQVEVPTILGEVNTVTVPNTDGTSYTFPAGLGVENLPLLTPELRIGNLFYTEALVRFVTFDLGEDAGRQQLLGLGLRNNFSGFFTDFPVDMSVAYYYQTFRSADNADATSHLVQLQVGKTFNRFFNLYGWAGFQDGSYQINYEYDGEEGRETVDLDLKVNTKWIVGAGASVKLSVFRFHAEATYSAQFVLAGGLGLDFGGKKRTE